MNQKYQNPPTPRPKTKSHSKQYWGSIGAHTLRPHDGRMQATGFNLPPGVSDADIDQALDGYLSDDDCREAYDELLIDAAIEDRIMSRLGVRYGQVKEFPPL